MVGLIGQLLESALPSEAVTRLTRLRPPDQAQVMAQLSQGLQAELLNLLSSDNLSAIIEELERSDAVELSQSLRPEQLPEVLDQARPDVAADVLRDLPEDIAAQILNQMKAAEEVAPLLEYEDDDAGGLMTPEFVALRDSMTVSQAMGFVRRWAEELRPEDISQLFVVDKDGVLTGGISLAQLVLARPYQYISLIMDPDVISVAAETDQERCARLVERYNLRSLPVVDDERRLVGVLKLEEIIDVVEDEATEDMYRMVGVAQEERVLGPFWRSVRGRLPWLCVNLVTVLMAGFVITSFESTLSRAIVLAAFLPVIAGQGGIAGTQTLTLVVRSLALGEIAPGSARRLLAKEVGLGLVHGVALGALIGVIAFVWKGSGYLALVAALAMFSNLVIAGISGVLVPLGFRAIRIDPALSSAVAVTTFTDVIGLLVYLGLAASMIGLITGSL